MNHPNYIPAHYPRRRLVLIGLATAIGISSTHGEDLKTESGRTYRDAIISRVEADGVVIKHRFGIVRVAFKNIAAESRGTFNPQKAAELSEGARRQDQEARERAQEMAQRTSEEAAERRRSVMAFEEDDEAEAEGFAARRHQNANGHPTSTTPTAARTFHVRGQIVAAGPTGYIVQCTPDRRRSESGFVDERLIVVTSDINEFVQGDYMDLRASAEGRETTFRTYLGEIYPGRFPVYRVIRDRRPQICIGLNRKWLDR